MQPNTTLQLFPTPVLVYSLERELTEGEDNVIDSIGKKSYLRNIGNSCSDGTYILDIPGMELLRADLTNILNHAFQTIHQPSTDCSLYITQSWINYTGRDQYHHQHLHTNSVYSAVLYLKTTAGDSIEFSRKTNLLDIFEFHPKTYNNFNNQTWRLPVGVGNVVVFPSSLTHGVAPVQHDGLRVSLAFNSFISGEIGAPHKLNKLVL